MDVNQFIGWVIVLVIVGLVWYRIFSGRAKKAISTVEGAGGKVWNRLSGAGGKSLLPLTVSGVAIIVIWGLLPGFWQWLWVKPLFVLALLAFLAAILLVNAKLKFAWPPTIVLMLVVLAAAPRSELPAFRYWVLPLAEAKQKTAADEVKAKEMAAAERAKVANETSTATEKAAARERRSATIIAPVNGWSNNFSLPAFVKFRIMPKGEVRIKTLSGRVWEDGPDRMNEPVNLASLWDRTIAVQSLEDQAVEVKIDWE